MLSLNLDFLLPIAICVISNFFYLFLQVSYLVTNFFGFFLTNAIFENRFYKYGYQWIVWATLPNNIAYDLDQRVSPKPGNHLFPPVGLCDLLAAVRDNKATLVNRYY